MGSLPPSPRRLPAGPGRRARALRRATAALLLYGLTSAVAVLGVLFGHYFLERHHFRRAKPDPVINAFTGWDSYWYKRIAAEGYSYNPEVMSSVAFFPAYPLLGRFVSRVSGVSTDIALLAVAHVCLAAAFVMAAAYVRRRFPGGPDGLAPYALLALGLWPTTLFFRVAYTESLFLLLTVVFLYGLERRWPLVVIAVVAGSATAVRSVGLGLLAPLALHLWHRSPTPGAFVLRAALVLPLACWGLAGFVLYQWAEFGQPLAFAQAQSHWQICPALPPGEKAMALLSLEPFWSVFDPSCHAFWVRHDGDIDPLFSWHIANVVFFALAVGLVVIGARRRWLSAYEVSLSACLLLIPYVGRGYDMGMQSAGRFAAVILPVYLVAGHVLCRLPGPVATALLCTGSFLLGMYSALFAAGHQVF